MQERFQATKNGVRKDKAEINRWLTTAEEKMRKNDISYLHSGWTDPEGRQVDIGFVFLYTQGGLDPHVRFAVAIRPVGQSVWNKPSDKAHILFPVPQDHTLNSTIPTKVANRLEQLGYKPPTTP